VSALFDGNGEYIVCGDIIDDFYDPVGTRTFGAALQRPRG
jgi:hypothetical protein